MADQLRRGLLLVLLLVAGALSFIYCERFDAEVLQQWITAAGIAGPLLFMALYAVGTVLFLPGALITLAGGALFGPVLGTLYNLTGATLGAALAFLIARFIGAAWVQQRSSGFSKRLLQGVEAEGWRFVAFTRLVPLFPFNLLNYALGLTRIPFWQYLVTTWICMLPGAIAYTYLGYAGREALAGSEGLVQKGLIALALLAALAFLPRLIGRLRQKPMLEITELKQRLDTGDELLILDVRTSDDFVGEQGHIAGSMNVPLEVLAKQLDHLSDYEEKPIAIVCRTDRRSAKAATILSRNGFADVYIVRNGMTAWHEQDWPVEYDVTR
ncbi:MAG: VTT domain-containing protein [Chromatiales bacterium]|jgi:uncharacterized membrane protein YdjX (TVP38/TMEM64 family)/rhodanese-related sulfurtransferase